MTSRQSHNDPIDICVFAIRETERAFLVVYGDDELWLPKSQLTIHDQRKVEIHHNMRKMMATSITGTIPEWLAMEKGLV